MTIHVTAVTTPVYNLRVKPLVAAIRFPLACIAAAWLARVPDAAWQWAYEQGHHVRYAHLASPEDAWLANLAAPIACVIVVLGWSLAHDRGWRIAWRVPVALAVIAAWALLVIPMPDRDGYDDWAAFRGDVKPGMGMAPIRTTVPGGPLHHYVALARCDGYAARDEDRQLHADDSGDCDGDRCEVSAIFPLAYGDILRLRDVSGDGDVELALAPRTYVGGPRIFGGGFDEVASGPIAKPATFEALAGMTGWYRLRMRGPRALVASVCLARVMGPGADPLPQPTPYQR